MVKYCKSCGSELDDGSVFCDECGTRADGSSSAGNVLFASYNIDMMDGEVVIRQSQIDAGCMILPLIVFAVGLFSMFIFIVAIGLLITAIGLIWLIIRAIGYMTNDLILTNKRVFGKCGLISTTQMQSPLNKIDSVSYSNGLMGKLIGYGTVNIATTSSNFKFRFIREGQTLYNDIFNQLEACDVERRNSDAKAIVDAMAEKLS